MVARESVDFPAVGTGGYFSAGREVPYHIRVAELGAQAVHVFFQKEYLAQSRQGAKEDKHELRETSFASLVRQAKPDFSIVLKREQHVK